MTNLIIAFHYIVMLSRITMFSALAIAAISVNSVQAIERFDGCETPPKPLLWGPWDYRNNKEKLPLVEGAHFTPEVEALIRGKSTTVIGADISYTLGIFPNHHRALYSMMRYSERQGVDKPQGAKYSVDCFFRRAMDFREDDIQARMLYAMYLVKKNRRKEALQQLEFVESNADDLMTTNYNLGLIYLDLNVYDKALAYAHKAYREGFPLPGLKNRLLRAGHWREFDNTKNATE